MDSSEARLRQLGYRQDLKRVLSHFGNFAVTFSVGSILSGVTASFGIGYSHGGPVITVWTWVAHALLALPLIASLAELCSSMPAAGGLFTWSYHLGGCYRRFWCWLTGWLNLTAWVGGTASAAFALAYVISTMVVLADGGIYGGGTLFSNGQFLGVVAAVLIAQGAINLLPTRVLAVINKISVAWNSLGALALIILLPSVAVKHQSAEFVFTNFQRNTYGNVVSDGYTAMLGFLYAVYSLSGIDTAAHMAEETRSADRGAARSILLTFYVNAAYGLAFVLAILFSMQDTNVNQLASGATGGFILAQVFCDIFVARFDSSTGAIAALTVPAVAIFLGGCSSVTTTSRVLWAFARDGALPLSSICQKVNRRTGVPANAVVVSTLLCILISLPLLRNSVAFSACVSIAILGGATAYLIPIALKILMAGTEFERGPIHLGRFSLPANAFAVVYLLFICSAAVMPTTFPITEDTLNYSPIAWGAVVLSALAVWFLPGRWGARRWFAGKRSNLGIHPQEAYCAPLPMHKDEETTPA